VGGSLVIRIKRSDQVAPQSRSEKITTQDTKDTKGLKIILRVLCGFQTGGRPGGRAALCPDRCDFQSPVPSLDATGQPGCRDLVSVV